MPARKPKLLDGPELLDFALRSLSGRAHSSGELKVRLQRRAKSPEDIGEVMAKLQEAGYLDDARYAQAYATARRDNQGFGRMRVLRDLRTRRVSPQMAEGAVRDAFEDVDESAMVEQYLARKYRATNLPEYLATEKNLASAYRRLRTAGFSSGVSIRVLKRYAARAEELAENIEAVDNAGDGDGTAPDQG
jgi:regulatory protein